MDFQTSDSWQAFIEQIPALKREMLQGEALWHRVEAIWSSILASSCEEDEVLLYHHFMFRLACEGIIPRELGARH